MAFGAVCTLMPCPNLVPLTNPERQGDIPLRKCVAAGLRLLLGEHEEAFDSFPGDVLCIALPDVPSAHALLECGNA